MNKLKIDIISLYEKISNIILCLIMKYRIKLNLYNKNLDNYQKNRTITLEESFNNNKFDNDIWNLEFACWGKYNHEQKIILKEEGYKIDNNKLQFYFNPDKGYWEGWEGEGNYYFNTAYFQTLKYYQKPGFYQKYGRFEMKCKLSNKIEAWPAFWLLSQRSQNSEKTLTPILPEIDIFESYVDDKTKKLGLIFTLHYGSNYDTSDKRQEANVIKNVDFSKDYWLISIEWTEKNIKWYLNNHLVKISRFSKIPDIHKPIHPCYVIFNEGLFPKYVDNMDKTKTMEGMSVDWIRIYKEKDDN